MELAEIPLVREAVQSEFARNKARQAPPADFPELPLIPAGRYTDPAFYDLEMKHLWPKVWLYAAHADELSEPRSYVLWEEVGRSVIIVRGRDDRIRAFHNTCRHRGVPLLKEPKGTLANIRCGYHSWTYDLDGSLKSVPEEHNFPDLEKEDNGLLPVRCEQFGNLVFINMDLDAKPLLESLSALPAELAEYKFDRLRFVTRYSMDVQCNWKVIQDAFQEAYHVNHIHPGSVRPLLDSRGATPTLYPGGHSRLVIPNTEAYDRQRLEAAEKNGGTPDPRHEITRTHSRSYNFWPNLTTATSEFEFCLQIFGPTGLNTSRMDLVWLTPEGTNRDPESEEWQARFAGFQVIADEDVHFLANSQVALSAPGFPGVRVSYPERRIYHHNEHVDRMIGPDRIPEALRLKPRLASFVACQS